MIDFVPLPIYTPIFNSLILIMVLVASIQGFSGTLLNRDTLKNGVVWGTVFSLLLVVYMGLRPISGYYFGDTGNYANSFREMQKSIWMENLSTDGEWVFNGLMYWFAQNSDVHLFFLFCAAVYIGALWLAVRRMFGAYNFLPLLVVMSMFTFWSYGVNGIRNGMASSLVILAFTYRDKLPIAIGLSIIALGIHKSMILTLGAAVLAWLVTNPKYYLMGWGASVLLSAATRGGTSSILLNMGLVGDDRFADYLTSTDYIDQFSSMGFRWDFLLFSALPIVVGWYFIFKKGYRDKIYIWLFNIYLTTNAFWVLVITAQFSNRFAQLSWFIMPLVLIYPFVKRRFWPDQSQKIGWALLVFYAYTFFVNFIA